MKKNVVANAEKQNQILSLNEVHVELQKAVAGSKCKVFTDSKFYTGFGVKANGFSVNVKKTKYNIYCSDSNYEVLASKEYADTVFTKDGNSADKTRPNSIECKSTEALKAMIAAVLEANYLKTAEAK